MSTHTETRPGVTTDEAYVAFLGELRAEFGRRRLKQSQIAPAMGMRQQHLSNRLNGVTPFSVPELLRLADAMGIAPVTLLAWAPRGSNPQPTGLRPDRRKRWRRGRRRGLLHTPPTHPTILAGLIPVPRPRERVAPAILEVA